MRPSVGRKGSLDLLSRHDGEVAERAMTGQQADEVHPARLLARPNLASPSKASEASEHAGGSKGSVSVSTKMSRENYVFLGFVGMCNG